MRGIILMAALAVLAGTAVAAHADGHGHNGGNWNNGGYDNWQHNAERRRDARRAGVITGLVVGAAGTAVAQSQVDQRYQDCLRAGVYDYECDRQRYQDALRAQENARRRAITAGLIARAAY